MNKSRTFRISFALKNTYRVNSILYSIKQVPLLKRVLPESLYSVGGLKIFANIVAALWELLTAFGGKLIYFLTMICGISLLYGDLPREQVFLHILLFLTAVGAFTNTYLFNPSRDKYYAMILMRMNARDYTLTNYGYSILKVVIGFLPFAVLFGRMWEVPLWICLLIPFFVAGAKLILAAVSLHGYDKTGRASNENKLGRFGWMILALLVAAAYGPPAAGLAVPGEFVVIVMIAVILGGILSAGKVISFADYRDMYQQILAESMSQMDTLEKQTQAQSRKVISADLSITSRRRGFEYLNELFIKRHQRILWKASKKIALV